MHIPGNDYGVRTSGQIITSSCLFSMLGSLVLVVWLLLTLLASTIHYHSYLVASTAIHHQSLVA